MRPNPLFASEDPELVRALVREHPWATQPARRKL